MYEDNDSGVEEEDFSDIEYSFAFLSGFPSREDIKRGKSHSSGSTHLHYSKTKRFVDMVTSKAVSRWFVFTSVISRKCYRIDTLPSGEPKLVYIGDTPVPHPYEYIKIPTFMCMSNLTL